MADQRMTWAALAVLYADNTAGAISPQDLRHGFASVKPHVASDAPTASDDETLGFDVGHAWIDTSTSPRSVYECVDPTTGNAVWVKRYPQDAGGGGAEAFTDLSDTPSDYTGSGGKFVAVTAGADGLEFVDAPAGPAHYDLELGFPGAPDAGAIDMLLVPRAVTIDDADPGEVHVGVNPTDGTAVIDIEVNGSSVGSIDIEDDGTVTWNLAADIELSAGDTLALVAPSPADSTLADVIVAFKGEAS